MSTETEVQTELDNFPKDTIIRRRCIGDAEQEIIKADGKGGERSVWQGMAADCTGSLSRSSLAGSVQYYERLLDKTNLLSKEETAAISNHLSEFVNVLHYAKAIVEYEGKYYQMVFNGLVPLTFKETWMWRLFGAMPKAKQVNERLVNAYQIAKVSVVPPRS